MIALVLVWLLVLVWCFYFQIQIPTPVKVSSAFYLTGIGILMTEKVEMIMEPQNCVWDNRSLQVFLT